MKILRRFEQQADLVRTLGQELRLEDSYRGVERLVQLTIQALLDLGLMVLSAVGTSPSGYRDVASSLAKLSLLSQEKAELMRGMAGLRDILVHAYVGTNREIVVESSKRFPLDAVRIADEIVSSARQVVDDPPGTNADQLAETLRQTLRGKVRLAFLFGSRVKGYSLKGDVDVALYFGKRPDPYEVGRLVSEIQESLGREDVDILILDDCDNTSLAHEAVQGKPILGSDIEILQLRTKIASEYIDYNLYVQRAKRGSWHQQT